jgi:hypothetical protein
MSERGALLFRVSANRNRDQYLWLLAGLAIAAVILIVPRLEHRRLDSPWPFLAAFYAAMFFVQRRSAVYENGIQLPADTSGARSRFIAWSHVERFHWDGDILTIVPTMSVMAGADLGRPLLGGSIRVPANKRAQMENLLAGKQKL